LRTIAIGTNTDPYQPIEKQHQIMRRILEVLDQFGHPVGIVTKSVWCCATRHPRAHGQAQPVKVALSVTTLDPSWRGDGAARRDAGAPADAHHSRRPAC
jgi:DNA repair photolyase